MLVSLRDVEEGIEQARTTADQHALDLATAEHERLILPLRAKAATLDSSSEIARAGILDTARTLKDYEARLNSIEAQKRSTAAAIAVAEHNHKTYISKLCAHSRQPPPVRAASQPPALANLATFVAPTAQQPPASANLVTFVAPAAQQPPASANPAPFVAPAARQPPASANPATFIAPAAQQAQATANFATFVFPAAT